MDFSEAFHDADMCKALLLKLEQKLAEYGQEIKFMEVCGTHTVSIFQSGLRSLLPKNIIHVSGPGCPVCVTHDSEVATFLTLAEREKVIITSFGDLMRVPSPDGKSLKHAKAQGADVQIVYSPLDALNIAKENPEFEVVFLGVGFETTVPTVAASILSAKKQKIKNFSVYSCHKLVPPALEALISVKNTDTENKDNSQPNKIDAFLLPGHVALVLGMQPFEFIAKQYNYPAIIAGFEPADIIHALYEIVEQKISGQSQLTNAYQRAVAYQGNPTAMSIVNQIFTVSDTSWRGLGKIAQSGLIINENFSEFDALKKLQVQVKQTTPLPGCKCGSVLSGEITPKDCPLFGKICTPQNPTGPCMVSTEGSCAAWYNYDGLD